MTDDDECIHGLGPVSACTICNGRARREAIAESESPRLFAAKITEHCPTCSLPIHLGQMLAWLPDRQVTHQDCWEES